MYRKPTATILSLLLFSLSLVVVGGAFLPLTVFSQTTPAAVDKRNIKISVSPNPVRTGESVAVRISVNVSGDQKIEPPQFDYPNFDLVDESVSRRITTVIHNGSYIPKQENTYTYLLYPKKPGEHPIKNISIKIGDKKVFLSNQFVVVRKNDDSPPSQNARQNPRRWSYPGSNGRATSRRSPGMGPGGGAQAGSQTESSRYRTNNNTGSSTEPSFPLNSDFTVRLQLSKSSAYVGEPVIAEYYLYDFNNLHKIDIKKWPTFNGFWKEDLEIPTRFNFEAAYVGGQRVRRALLGRFALYPLKPGKLSIDKLIVNGMYSSNMHRGRRNNPFDMFFSHRSVKRASHSSQNKTVSVTKLPEDGRPTDFYGAVGQFDISIEADKSTVKENEPITFTFKISGEGNVHEVEEPKIKFPDTFDLYESKTKIQTLAPRGVRIALKKTKQFDLLVLPRKEGKYTVGKLEWPYFDPKSKEYKIITTEPIEIEVGPGDKSKIDDAVIIANANFGNGGVPAVLPKKELRYLKSADNVMIKSFNLNSRIFENLAWSIFGLNFLLFGLLAWRNKNSLVDFKAMQNTRTARIHKAIAEIDAITSGSKSNFDNLQNAIHSLLLAALESKNFSLTRSEIAHMWKEKSLSETFLKRAFNFLDQCDAARFSGNSDTGSSEFKATAKKARQLLKQAKSL